MFTVNLIDLDRSGPIQFHRFVPMDHALWEGADLELSGPVEVDLLVTATATGQVLADGRLRAPIRRRCRRCLEPVELVLDEALSLVWEIKDELEEEDDGEIRPLDPVGNQLDMQAAIREELILLAPAYVVCGAECRGLCPICGIDRNKQECDCTHDEPDPRWNALRDLGHE